MLTEEVLFRPVTSIAFPARAGRGHDRDADRAVRFVRDDDVLHAHGRARPRIHLAVVDAALVPLDAARGEQDAEVHVAGPGFAKLHARLAGHGDVGEMRAREPRIHDRTEAAVARGGEKARNETLDLRCGSFRLHEDDRLLRRRALRGAGRGRAGRGGRGSAAEEREESGDGGEAAHDLHGVKVYALVTWTDVVSVASFASLGTTTRFR